MFLLTAVTLLLCNFSIPYLATHTQHEATRAELAALLFAVAEMNSGWRHGQACHFLGQPTSAARCCASCARCTCCARCAFPARCTQEPAPLAPPRRQADAPHGLRQRTAAPAAPTARSLHAALGPRAARAAPHQQADAAHGLRQRLWRHPREAEAEEAWLGGVAVLSGGQDDLSSMRGVWGQVGASAQSCMRGGHGQKRPCLHLIQVCEFPAGKGVGWNR